MIIIKLQNRTNEENLNLTKENSFLKNKIKNLKNKKKNTNKKINEMEKQIQLKYIIIIIIVKTLNNFIWSLLPGKFLKYQKYTFRHDFNISIFNRNSNFTCK